MALTAAERQQVAEELDRMSKDPGRRDRLEHARARQRQYAAREMEAEAG